MANALHHVCKNYDAMHTDIRGREWQAVLFKDKEAMGIAPITWSDEMQHEMINGKFKRPSTLRMWFKTMDLFDSYVRQPVKLALLANAVKADIPYSEARKLKEFVRAFEVSVEGKPQWNAEANAYCMDAKIVRWDP